MKKRLSILLIAFMILGLLAGCSGGNKETSSETPSDAGEAPAPKKEEVIIAQSTDVSVLDPHDCNQVASFMAIRQIFSSLVGLNETGDIVPDLAKEWTNISPTEWEFLLRDDAVFHDGSPVTAEDVKFSIERQQSMPKMKSLVENIVAVDIIDDHKVKITTGTPDATLFINLAGSATRIIPKKVFTEKGEEKFAIEPVGSGPLKFVEWIQGEKLVLEKFDDYYGDNSDGAKTIIFKGIPEGTSRTIALETGEADLIIGIEAADVDKIESNSKLEMHQAVNPRVEYIGFNLKKKPYDNKLVRQAINYATDKESINIVSNNDRYEIAQTVIAPCNFGFNADIKGFDYNPDKAKELLKEAGFPDGFKTKIWASGDVRNRIAQVLQANLKDVGIEAEIELLEMSSYIEKTAAGEHEIMILGWESNSDGDLAMYPQFHTTKHGAAGNRVFYSNKEVDKLLDDAKVELDVEKRRQMYKDAQVIIVDDAPWVPMYYPTFDVATQAGLKGLVISSVSTIDFYKLHY